jgi:TonB family protein
MHPSKARSLVLVIVALAHGGCGGSQEVAEAPLPAPTLACDHPLTLPEGATFGDVLDGSQDRAGACIAAGEQRVALRWAARDRPRITLSADAVDVGSSGETLCAWYGRCDATTHQRELLDESSVMSTVDCLLEDGPPGDVVIRASREVSADVLASVVERVELAGRDVEIERRPVAVWFPCQPARRSRGDAQLPEDIVRSAVAPHLREAQRCYARHRPARGDRGGRVVLRFMVAPDGAVEEVTTATSTLDAPDVEQCVLAQVRGWTFPAPGGEQSIIVTYPLDLGPRARRR